MAPMFLTFRHALIVAVIGFADVVATGGTGQAGAVEPTGEVRTARRARS